MIWLSLFFTVLIFVLQILKKRTKRISPTIFNNIFKKVFFLTIIVFLLFSAFLTYEQYYVWKSNDLSRFLLPPHQSWTYFAEYVVRRIFGNSLIALTASFLFVFFSQVVNRKSKERFFYPEEIWIAGTAFFLVGNPGWIFYLLIILVVYLLAHLFVLATKRGDRRISFYYLWMPAAFLAIMIFKILQSIPLWNMMII